MPKNIIDHIYDSLQDTINTRTIENFVRLGIPLNTFAALGVVEGMKVVHKFGRTTNAGAAFSDIWMAGGVFAWPTTASQLEAISASANDDDGGSGASKIIIEGLDSNFDEISEEVTMNGQAATSPTSQSFLRINRAYVSESGTYGTTTAGSNAGIITIRIASAGATQATIDFETSVGRGQTELGRYTIPAGFTGIVELVSLNVAGGKTAHLSVFQRQNADDVTAPYTGARRLIYEVDDLDGHLFRPMPNNIVVPEKTDIWGTIHSASAAGSTAAEIQFDVGLFKVT